MQLELSPQEHELLLNLLESDLSRLNWDSARTHRATFRAELKVREELIEALLAKLESLAMPTGAL
jgi:hypothetical protein